jgi:hypothetical protein
LETEVGEPEEPEKKAPHLRGFSVSEPASSSSCLVASIESGNVALSLLTLLEVVTSDSDRNRIFHDALFLSTFSLAVPSRFSANLARSSLHSRPVRDCIQQSKLHARSALRVVCSTVYQRADRVLEAPLALLAREFVKRSDADL